MVSDSSEFECASGYFYQNHDGNECTCCEAGDDIELFTENLADSNISNVYKLKVPSVNASNASSDTIIENEGNT